MTTVYVVAWQYNSGAGFDWYRTAADADAAFEKEKQNADELCDESWCAYRFDVTIPGNPSASAITEVIDGDIDWYCQRATTVYPRHFVPQPEEV